MSAYIILCVQILVIQTIAAQIIGSGIPAFADLVASLPVPSCRCRYSNAPWALTPGCLSASRGKGLVITSKSPIAPTGISISSNAAIDGCLAVTGSLPLLGTISLEGALPTYGCGAVEYGCGYEIGMVSEEITPVAPIATCLEITANPTVLAASNSPGLICTSVSPGAPEGVMVSSDNRIRGELSLGGALPFLGSVGLEGALPTSGCGSVAYNCGNGGVGIARELDGFGYGGVGFGNGCGGARNFGSGAIGHASPCGCGGFGPGSFGSLGFDGIGVAGRRF